jgi:hypothetical protein
LLYVRERFGFKAGVFLMAERTGDAAVSLPFYPRIPTQHVADGLKRLLSGDRGVAVGLARGSRRPIRGQRFRATVGST